MKAMILAAGRGKRMGRLTENTPKPLLKVGKYTLIEWQILRLQKAGFTQLVINLGYLGEQIADYLGTGERYGVTIEYSLEPQEGLETGGGVLQALPLLGEEPFVLTNADVFCDYPYEILRDKQVAGIHLVLVDTPEFKSQGDFSLEQDNLVLGEQLTFAGISLVNPAIFEGCRSGFFPIAPLFRKAITTGKATAEHFCGQWFDVGTAERLAQVCQLSSKCRRENPIFQGQ